MMKKLLLCCVLLLLFILPVSAETAADRTASCTFTLGKTKLTSKEAGKLKDKNYSTHYDIAKRKTLTIESDKTLGAMYLQIFDKVRVMTIEVKVNGEWQALCENPQHLSDWYAFPENTTGVRIYNGDKEEKLQLAEVTLYGPGEKPANVPQWVDLEKADLMLLVAHPDDDLLWFGGLMPTYAGERGYKVQVAFLVPTGGLRKLEMMDALWTCGVTAYPALLNMGDRRGKTLQEQYSLWGQKTVTTKIVEVIRRFKPDVLVTHGLGGEYGHAAHKAVSDTVTRAVGYAADSTNRPASVEKYGIWQVKKVYMHEYSKNQIVMDWHVPLEAFGGKDGLAVAQEAMLCHASQVKGGWMVEDHGKHDNTIFGLYFTTVGEDIEKNDFMENIVPEDAAP